MNVQDRDKKPWLTPLEQIAHLKSKGVRFDLISETDACSYLAENNNYFRIRSYRTNFEKVTEGARKGQYANLDFKMLVDLSIVDMLLRNELLPMSLDIEHFSKVRLLRAIETRNEDGYDIVADFLNSQDRQNRDGSVSNTTKREIERGRRSAYTANLLNKYPEHDYPAWVFMEVVAFGTFLSFYKFSSERFRSKTLRDEFYLLQSVKSIRNACAHNNCILNNMTNGTSMFNAQPAVTQALGDIGVSLSQRRSKMRIDIFQQIATTFFMHQKLSSSGIKEHRTESLLKFEKRMNKRSDYYKDNYQVTSGFSFISQLIHGWYDCKADDEAYAQQEFADSGDWQSGER